MVLSQKLGNSDALTVRKPLGIQRCSPALCVPCELLQDIFRLAFPRKTVHDTPEVAHFLVCGHVCSYWRYALSSDPYMWSRISLPKFPPNLINQCLSYSKDRPLEIYVRGDGFHFALDQVFSHMHRIKSLVIENRTEWDLANHLSRPAHCLETLGILDSRLEIEPNSPLLFQHQTPTLKSVNLQGVSNVPFRTLLYNLIHLNLQRLREAPSLDELFDILESCPRLESFRTNHLSTPLTEIPVDRCVNLSSLSLIELQAPASLLSAFLCHTIIPYRAKWTLKCSEIEILSDPVLLSFRLCHSVGETGLRLIAGKVLFASLYEYRDRNVEKRSGELCINTGSVNIPSLHRKLVDSGTLSQIITLELNYLAMWSAKGFYESILWRFPDIRYLIIVASVPFTSAHILNCLWDVLSGQSETPVESFPCPSLKHLVIHAPINTTPVFDALLSCLRRRHRQSPLESLRIIDNIFQITQVDMGRLTQYVPNVQITKKDVFNGNQALV